MKIFPALQKLCVSHDEINPEPSQTPEIALENAIIHIESEIKNANLALKQAMEADSDLNRKLIDAQKQRDEAQNGALRLVISGKDDLATEALQEKIRCEDKISRLSEIHASTKATVENMSRQLNAMRLKLEELKSNKNMLSVRAAAASARKSFAEVFADFDTKGFGAFESLQSFVDSLEVDAEAFEILANNSKGLQEQIDSVTLEESIRQNLELLTKQITIVDTSSKSSVIAQTSVISIDSKEQQTEANINNEQLSPINNDTTFQDDVGWFERINDTTFQFNGDKSKLQHSEQYYRDLLQFDDEAAKHFRKYLPLQYDISPSTIILQSEFRIAPIVNLTLPDYHVAWILSRLLEFIGWLHQNGLSHNGICPESVFVIPETHGIICSTFYYGGRMGNTFIGASERYKNWYPQSAFLLKKSIPAIDISLAKRTAIYLLGDTSGNGTKLFASCDERLVSFLISTATDDTAYDTYQRYRKLLDDIFGKPIFHSLYLSSQAKLV